MSLALKGTASPNPISKQTIIAFSSINKIITKIAQKIPGITNLIEEQILIKSNDQFGLPSKHQLLNMDSTDIEKIAKKPGNSSCIICQDGEASCKQIREPFVFEFDTTYEPNYYDFGITDFLSTQINNDLKTGYDSILNSPDSPAVDLAAFGPKRYFSFSELGSIEQIAASLELDKILDLESLEENWNINNTEQVKLLCSADDELHNDSKTILSLPSPIITNPKPLIKRASLPIQVKSLLKSPCVPHPIKRVKSFSIKSKNSYSTESKLWKQRILSMGGSLSSDGSSSSDESIRKPQNLLLRNKSLRKQFSVTSTWEIEAIIEEKIQNQLNSKYSSSELDLYSNLSENKWQHYCSQEFDIDSINDLSITDIVNEDEELISELERYAYFLRLVRMKKLARQETYNGNIAPSDFCIYN